MAEGRKLDSEDLAMIRKLSGREILALPVDLECFGEGPDYGLNVETVRDYMVHTLWTYWQEGYRFDGKYAFGGNWSKPILWALADADAIEGIWEMDAGQKFSFEEYDQEDFKALVASALEALR